MKNIGSLLIENGADPDWQDKVSLNFILAILLCMKLSKKEIVISF